MKLINYKRGYIQEFDCAIHGRIIISGKKELSKFRKLINNMPVDRSYPWIKELAIERMGTDKKCFCLGVTPTEYIVDKFKLSGYKRGNYMFTVNTEL